MLILPDEPAGVWLRTAAGIAGAGSLKIAWAPPSSLLFKQPCFADINYDNLPDNLYRMKHIEHIGIAVKELATAVPLFEKLLDTRCYKTESVASERVNTAFLRTGETKLELLEAADEQSVIAGYISKKGEGIHHIAFEVDDIEAEMKRLSEEGFVLLNQEPKKGADNKLVCFLHPKSTNGTLIELCMEIK